MPYLLSSNRLLVDDSFYSLNIARNIAIGEGMTHDGFNETNGFQPLYVAIMVPIYALFGPDKVLPVQVGLTLMSIIDIATAWLIFLLIRALGSARGGLLGAALWVSSAAVIRTALNGLETCLFLFFMTLATYYYVVKIRPVVERSFKRSCIFGAMIGFVVLTRIDGFIFVGMLGLDQLYLRMRQKEVRPWLPHWSAMSAVFLAVISPWIIIGLVGFGQVLPTSGQATRFLSVAHDKGLISHVQGEVDPAHPSWTYLKTMSKRGGEELETLLADVISPISWLSSTYNIPSAVLTVALVLLSLLVVGWLSRKKKGTETPNIRSLSFMLYFSAALWAAYTYYIFGLWHYHRYFMPIALFTVIVVSLALSLLFETYVQDKKSMGAKVVMTALLAILFVPGIFNSWSVYIDQQHRSKPGFRDLNWGFYEGARMIDQIASRDETCGAFQSGILDYFSEAPIINLGGVVNDAALKAMKEKKLMDYIEKQGIRYIVDWPENVESDLLPPYSGSDALNRLKLIEHCEFVGMYRVEERDS